jgi:hypothetical protein
VGHDLETFAIYGFEFVANGLDINLLETNSVQFARTITEPLVAPLQLRELLGFDPIPDLVDAPLKVAQTFIDA